MIEDVRLCHVSGMECALLCSFNFVAISFLHKECIEMALYEFIQKYI